MLQEKKLKLLKSILIVTNVSPDKSTWEAWVNGELVRGGYAYVYPRYATTERLYEFEEEARESQAGIWKLPENERVKPWERRKQKREWPLTTRSGRSNNSD